MTERGQAWAPRLLAPLLVAEVYALIRLTLDPPLWGYPAIAGAYLLAVALVVLRRRVGQQHAAGG
jgi:hypothetical protein